MNEFCSRIQSILLAIALVATTTPFGFAQEKIDFDRQVKPILSDNCFACHGPDQAQSTADFRLDQKESALSKDHSIIVPHKPKSSLLIERIYSKDPDTVMPPSDHRKKLSKEQKETLKSWIEQGAEWSEHWAFKKPTNSLAPKVPDNLWSKTFIDNYILKRLRAKKIEPSPTADHRTLLRRLSFDLTGLAPSAESVKEFEVEIALYGFYKAYEEQVDRLLESPHFGERMAVYWLDLVRYADTVGYHGDQNVSVSPYRDYVIEAFNDNMPFDQFTREQLAGDLFEAPTLNQKIASGYNRLGMMSAEGGVQPEEYLNKYASDRVRTTASVWLGVTLGCAECHDHKFDPLPTKEFYQFSAFFADIKEKGLYSGKLFGESIQVPDDDLDDFLAPIDQELRRLKSMLIEDESLRAERLRWESSLLDGPTDYQWKNLKPTSVVAVKANLAINDDNSLLVSGPNSDKECYLVVAAVDPNAKSLRLEALPHDSFPRKGPGRAGNGNFVVTEFLAVAGDQSGKIKQLKTEIKKWPKELTKQIIKFENPTASFEQHASAGGHPDKKWSAKSAIDHDAHGRQWGWAVMPQNSQNELVVQIDSTQPLPETITFVIQQNHGNGNHTLGRFRLSQSQNKNAIATGVKMVPDAITEIAKIKAEDRSEDQKTRISDYYIKIAPRYKKTHQEIESVANRREETAAGHSRKTLVTVAVKPRTIRVLARGNWMDKTGEVVEPNVPTALGGKNWNPEDLRGGRATRMELANWIVSSDNPLTARVFANRTWRMFFGNGISNVLDDLGSQGEPPSHPELLDRLAIEFIESGWDVKKLVRSIVTSATYQQSSALRADLRTVDPENRLLARQSRFRLDAEFIRDHALKTGGLLVETIGGKSVMPYQPTGLYRHLNFPKRKYKASSGYDQYRRGLYTHWQRQFLHPAMKTFDAPSREECTAARARSSTPLAALVMLNDPSYVEAARSLAKLTVNANDDQANRIQWMFKRSFSRKATEEEISVIEELLESNMKHFKENIEDAKLLLSTGQGTGKSEPESTEKLVEHAAWTAVSRAVMNMHEFILRK